MAAWLTPLSAFNFVTKVSKKPRRLEEEPFIFPFARTTDFGLQWSRDHPEVIEARDDFAFGALEWLPEIEKWLISLLEARQLMTQQKGLLFIDGTVKSGKTLIARYLFPFLIDHLRRTSAHPRLQGLDFAFTYLDLSSLRGQVTANDKWVALENRMRALFGEYWQPPDPPLDAFSRVQMGLRALKTVPGAPRMWFFSLDEYHFLFQGLNEVRAPFFLSRFPCAYLLCAWL